MKNQLEKFTLFLNKKCKVTPNVLTYARVFAAPWLALLISKVLSEESLPLAIFTIFLYFLAVFTDVLDGILARALPAEKNQNHSFGGMLDRLSDKIFIIFMLIPFGLNLYTFIIILGESLLTYQVIFSPPHQKQAKLSGKIKMVLQTFLIPILLLYNTTSFIPNSILYIYIIFTIIFTFISIYGHYFKND